jgi:hypothetical protein
MDPLTPSAWTAIKAHKPEKDHPARIVISHIGCPQEHLAKELICIIQPLSQKCPFDIKNSTDLACLVKKWNLDRDDVIFSVDAKALFPSIPIAECIRLIFKDLQEDATLPDRTKLNPDDIKNLLRLCLSSSQFVYDGQMHTANDSGPIGLSLMVTISAYWMSYTLKEICG